jgi:hypothetical protein
MDIGELAAEHFEALVGGRLVIETAQEAIECELQEVVRLRPHALRAAPPFALILRGPAERPLGQGIYGLQHPTLGRFELLMVPVARDAAGYRYEITFN